MDKDWIISAVVVLLILCIFLVGIAFGMAKFSEATDNYYYNDGICIKCGGNYSFYQIVPAQDTEYAYRCDKCGNIITLESYR